MNRPAGGIFKGAYWPGQSVKLAVCRWYSLWYKTQSCTISQLCGNWYECTIVLLSGTAMYPCIVLLWIFAGHQFGSKYRGQKNPTYQCCSLHCNTRCLISVSKRESKCALVACVPELYRGLLTEFNVCLHADYFRSLYQQLVIACEQPPDLPSSAGVCVLIDSASVCSSTVHVHVPCSLLLYLA